MSWINAFRLVTFGEDCSHTRHFSPRVAEAAFPRSDDHPILSHCHIFKRGLHRDSGTGLFHLLGLLARYRTHLCPYRHPNVRPNIWGCC